MPRVRRDRRTYERALQLAAAGLRNPEIGRLLDVPPRTVRNWLIRRPAYLDPANPPAGGACHLCAARPMSDRERRAYAYLLGMYLGDGTITSGPRGVYRLCISLDSRYPEIISECAAAVSVFHGTVNRAVREGCTMVNAYSKHWVCYFPQHGPGVKHQRVIRLADWQQAIAAEHPRLLLRGLIQSDGCRVMNRVRGGRYVYPRYMFSNRSADIARIFQDACDAVGARWTVYRWMTSVSRRDSVALLDEFIGPKA